MDIVSLIAVAVCSYIYGSVPFALLAVRRFSGKNLSREGTGNIGVTSAFKVGGRVAGICAVAGEISKGILPVMASRMLLPESAWAAPLSLLCAVCGTCYSLFLRGRGGRGTTAAFWGLALLSPLACCIMLLLVLVCLKIPDPRLVLKRIRILLIPGVLHLVEGDAALTGCGGLMAGLFLVTSFTRKDDFRHYGISKK